MTVGIDYSKKQVNRAGKLLRNLAADDTASLEGFDTEDFYQAITVIEWWRSIHARPLARVNANLRYYIRKAGADPEVTERLKRFSTITHKLQREPTMALSSMEDIGGVRAILPSQEQVLAVCEMLNKADPLEDSPRPLLHRRRRSRAEGRRLSGCAPGRG